MSKVALVILFNHNYEANIEKLEKLYYPKFDDIFFIMPFYRGTKINVISVYENSYYFGGYIAKTLEKIRNESFEHYLIIGDDLILNPGINQDNYSSFFQLDKDTGFMPELFLLNDITQTSPDRPMAPYWPALIDALKFRIDQKGIEVEKFLPSYNVAVQLLARHNLKFTPNISAEFFIKPLKNIPTNKADYEYRKRAAWHLVKNQKYLIGSRKLSYPLIGGYSDICIVPANALNDFIFFNGIFAALNLFAEIALPTAFAFAVQKNSSEQQLKKFGLTFWNPDTVNSFQKKYNLELATLFDKWPEDTIYIHPIKLSRWN